MDLCNKSRSRCGTRDLSPFTHISAAAALWRLSRKGWYAGFRDGAEWELILPIGYARRIFALLIGADVVPVKCAAVVPMRPLALPAILHTR